jgi:peptidoglycan/xylan/chitin deacetylase (PgdA/CDA1 family)
MKWLPILGYHRVVERIPVDDYCDICTTREHFERQMRFLAQAGYRTLSLEEAGKLLASDHPIPPKRFAITFDDGYQDILSGAIPLLKELGFTATIFMVSDFVGKTNAWDEGKGCLAPLLSWEQLRMLLQAGFSIGSHTVAHPDLSQLPQDQAWHEISESRKILEKMLNTPVRSFCYPYGKWSEETHELVREAGYDLACNDVWRPEHDLFALARVNARYSLSPWITLLRCQEPYFALRSFAQRAAYPRMLPPSIPGYLSQKWRQFTKKQANVKGKTSAS